MLTRFGWQTLCAACLETNAELSFCMTRRA
jgi:hypothetical protein